MVRAKGPQLIARDYDREAQTSKVYMDMGLWSPQTITAESGKNYEEEQRNIRKAREEKAQAVADQQPDITPPTEESVTEAEKYSHIDFSPPEGVRKAAARGLELRKKHNRGGTAVGVARARTLSNGQSVSPSTAKRMHSYFARHEVDKKGEGWGEDSAGYIAWLLWGGDAGKAWASKLVKQIDSADKKEAYIPEAAMDDKISDKIKLLMDEGKPQAQAVAIALSMARRGEL